MIAAIEWIHFDSDGTLNIFGVRMIGIDRSNGHKLLLTLIFIAVILLVSRFLHFASRNVTGTFHAERVTFWIRQGISLLMALLVLLGVLSIWFSDSSRLATFLGLVTAGLAFALQKVVTSFAGYLVILRGNTFTVGDRIVMGGVRGDVIKLGFIQTTIMEMGQPPGEQADEPAMWVHSRQYTGRVVTVTNDKVFDTPIFNYTREFPYIWEEIRIPVGYKDDRAAAERIILAAANELTADLTNVGKEVIAELQRRYLMKSSSLKPRVYWRLTDNWLEMSVRFIAMADGVRDLKDQMSRRILAAFDDAGISIASSTYDIVGFPPIRIVSDQPKPQTASDGR